MVCVHCFSNFLFFFSSFLTFLQSLLEKRLLNESDDNDISQAEVENKVFYLKMIGDYYRYLAEMSVTDG